MSTSWFMVRIDVFFLIIFILEILNTFTISAVFGNILNDNRVLSWDQIFQIEVDSVVSEKRWLPSFLFNLLIIDD